MCLALGGGFESICANYFGRFGGIVYQRSHVDSCRRGVYQMYEFFIRNVEKVYL